MKVESLSLTNFRNIKESVFLPDPNLNFLIGSNGQGKTSFIEAIGFLSTLRSFRDYKANHLIRNHTRASEIRCTIFKNSSETTAWKTKLRISLQRDEPESPKVTKTAYVNEKPFKSSTQFLSQRFGSYELGFHAIVFNPADHDLIKGDSATRRAYLDRVIAAEDLQYLKWMQKYKRILEQRNLLLKDGRNLRKDVLAGFTEAMGTYAAQITLKRLQWIQKAFEPLNQMLSRIAPQQTGLRLGYVSNWIPELSELSDPHRPARRAIGPGTTSIHFTGQADLPSLKLLEQSFWKSVVLHETTELRLGHSLVGPHRDDWSFFLGDQALKGQGSQGEIRSVLLALKLTEIELFRKETGHRPLFLMDDFSSELDKERRLFLLEFLTKIDLQIFVTTTEDPCFVGKRFWVSGGMIEEGLHDNSI